MLVVIAIVSGLYYFAGIEMRRLGRVWINPMTFVLVYYFFNYPVRALLIVYFPDTYNSLFFEDGDVILGLVYSAVYVAIFVGTYVFILRTFRVTFECPALVSCKLDTRLFLVSSTVVLLAGAAVLGYEVESGGSFSLGQDIQELRRPLWVNLFGVFFSLKWFSLCLGVLVSIRTKNPKLVFATFLILLMIVAEGILSTGKGFLAVLFLMFLFIDNFLTGRIVRLPVALVGAIILIFFSAYSYYSRINIGFGAESEGGFKDFFNFFSSGDVFGVVGDQLEIMLDRGTYYLDGLIIMIRDGLAVAPGPYAFGSAIEIFNIIPRAAGLGIEQYSFDRHITESVWKSWVFSQIFIGRIGESYFVLGYLGVIYGVINASVFAFVARRWKSSSKSLAGIALYFSVLVSWLHQDASLFYQIKSLLYILIAFGIVKVLSRA